MDLNSDLSWIRHHLILLTIVCVLIFGGVYGIESLIEKHDAAQSDKWTQILKTQEAETANIRQELTANENRWSAENASALATINRLAGSITSRNQQTQIQTTKDATLSVVEAAEKLRAQTHADTGQIITQGDSINIDLPTTRSIVSSLDILPAVQANLSDAENQLKAETSIATNLQLSVDKGTELIAALDKQIKDQDTACKGQIAVVKAEARKSKIRWFVIGGFMGGIARGFLGI